ncbi:MAG: UDP-N-acetylmuramoyl-L-alanyl-D-glutamate--2,6-diaminopimelate ligase [bacterium]
MHKIKQAIPQSLKNIYHLTQAILANVVFGFPSKKIKVIGVTGTDGKTTTVQMITKIFQESGKKVAMASTINFVIDGVEEKNLSHFTTESAFALQKFISKATSAGCEYLILETSSHSLDQHRVWGIEFQTAVITNVTREHLDYHGTMEKYRQAKKMLFEVVSKNKGTVIVNLDMEKSEDYLQYANEKSYGYSTNDKIQTTKSKQNPNDKIQKVVAKDIELGISSSTFKIYNFLLQAYPREEFKINLPGLFNIENALAATCVALSEGIELEMIKEALGKIKGVAGRMESVENNKGLNILVDFALTPNALERLYKLLFDVKKEGAKIIAVFGSCGDRDKGKRPIMGEVVSKYADFIVLTNDEPYHENPEQIIEEIAVGIKDKIENQSLWKISDRRIAIAKALEIAKENDVICVTGMGNFESMVVGDKKIPWNDKQVIQEELQKTI